ncbi:hypothetical protein CAL7716_059270 [Calothrix sp. PCC 7716]|nr:hypothetical protein CAL7716_059270 [Calothrix sp. PCC 7716]
MNSYPLIKYPSCLSKVFSEQPPIPAAPKQPSRPIQTLPSKPIEPGIFSATPPKRLSLLGLGIGGVGVAIIGAVISNITNNSSAGITAFIIGTVIVALVGWGQHISYPSRKDKYKEQREKHELKVTDYPAALRQWELQRNQAQEAYQQELEIWQQKVESIQFKHELDKQACSTPEAIQSWRESEFRRRIQSLNPAPLSIGQIVERSQEDKRGYAEYPNSSRFPALIREYFGHNNIHILRKMSLYTPDFALIDTTNKICIDVEIDEPYTPRQYPNCDSELKLTHCVDADNARNKCFIDADWFVIRFSEKQVLLYPESCCKVIAQLLSDCTGNTSVLNQFFHVPDLQPEIQWTREEAYEKARSQERLNYRRTPSAPKAQSQKPTSNQDIRLKSTQYQRPTSNNHIDILRRLHRNK